MNDLKNFRIALRFKQLRKFASDNYFWFLLFGVFFLAFILRFYNFDSRFALWSDQARDVLIGRVAFRELSLPLVGSFSSGGPFVFGPLWYWFIAITSFFSSSILIPWIGEAIVSLLFILVLFLIGKELGGKILGLVIAFLAAISPEQIIPALSGTHHAMVGIFAALSILFFLRYLKEGKTRNLFFLALSLATTINMHYQGLYLLVLVPVAVLFKRPKLSGIVLFPLGFFIPFIPLLIFEIQNQFFNTRNLLDFYLHGQYRLYVPNRWLTYAGIFWPTLWGKLVGGNIFAGYLTMIVIGSFFIIEFVKRKLNKSVIALAFSFLFVIIWFRYFRGERFDGYLIFLHPLIFIFSGWIIFQLKKIPLGIVFSFVALALLSLGSLWQDIGLLQGNNMYSLIKEIRKELSLQFPSASFAVYDLGYKSTGFSFSLSLVLDEEKKAEEDGIPIGVCSPSCPGGYSSIFKTELMEVSNLKDQTREELEKDDWFLVTPRIVHDSGVNWWKDGEY